MSGVVLAAAASRTVEMAEACVAGAVALADRRTSAERTDANGTAQVRQGRGSMDRAGKGKREARSCSRHTTETSVRTMSKRTYC